MSSHDIDILKFMAGIIVIGIGLIMLAYGLGLLYRIWNG